MIFHDLFSNIGKFFTNPCSVSSWNISKIGARALEFSYFLWRPSRTIRPCQAFFYDCTRLSFSTVNGKAVSCCRHHRPTDRPNPRLHLVAFPSRRDIRCRRSLSLPPCLSRPTWCWVHQQQLQASIYGPGYTQHSRNNSPSFVPLPQYTLAPRLTVRVSTQQHSTVWPG